MRSLTASVLLAFALAVPATAIAFPTLAPVATGAPSSIATPDPGTMQALALRVFADLQANKIDRASFTTRGNDDLTDRTVELLSRKLAPLGKPSAFVFNVAGVSGDVATSIYRVVSSDGRSHVVYSISFDVAQGKVDALSFGPISKP